MDIKIIIKNNYIKNKLNIQLNMLIENKNKVKVIRIKIKMMILNNVLLIFINVFVNLKKEI